MACIAQSMIDNSPQIKIVNLEALPRGLGCNYLLVVLSPYDGEYVAKRWLRKLPQTVQSQERIIRL